MIFKSEKYMSLIIGAIIALLLFIPVIIHMYIWGDTNFIPLYIYTLVLTSVGSALIILIYRKIETQKIKKIMRVGGITYLIMLPVIYLTQFVLAASIYGEYGGAFYMVVGILISPLLIIENAIIFIFIMFIWYKIKKIYTEVLTIRKTTGNFKFNHG